MIKEINQINKELETVSNKANKIINWSYIIEGTFQKGDKKDKFLGDFITSFTIRKKIKRVYKKKDMVDLLFLVQSTFKKIKNELRKIEEKADLQHIKIKRELNVINARIKSVEKYFSQTIDKYVLSERYRNFKNVKVLCREYNERDILELWLDASYYIEEIGYYLKCIGKKKGIVNLKQIKEKNSLGPFKEFNKMDGMGMY